MHLSELHISTQPPAMPKNEWVKQGLNQHNCCFIGYLSNAQALHEMLFSGSNKAYDSQDDSKGLAQLIDMAVQRWGHKVNQYLQGDYVIAWFDENQQHLCITASARASFSLFYNIQRQKDDQIAVACDIKALHQTRNRLNPGHWLQQLSLGPLIGRYTYLDNIRRLQPGETIIWDLNAYKCAHQVKLEGEQQLKFANQALSECFNSAPTISLNSDNNRSPSPNRPSTLQLFNGLPQVAHHLGEPINDALLAQFDWQISQCDAPVVKLDQSWFAGRLNVSQQPFIKQQFDSKVNWQKSIIRDSLLKYRRQFVRRQDYLYTAFEVDNQGLTGADKLDFAQWLDLHFVIPAWAQLYQRIANGYGKTVINPFMQGQNALAMINSSTEQHHEQKQIQAQQEQGFFNIDDHSMCNIYDAMQRLFRNGEKTSQQWFRLTPTVTAKFIKQSDKHSDPQLSRLKLHRPVEQTCIAMLTFDYLAKFHRNHIDSEIDT